MRFSSTLASTLAVSLLVKDVLASIHRGHLQHHHKRVPVEVIVDEIVYEEEVVTATVTNYVTVEWEPPVSSQTSLDLPSALTTGSASMVSDTFSPIATSATSSPVAVAAAEVEASSAVSSVAAASPTTLATVVKPAAATTSTVEVAPVVAAVTSAVAAVVTPAAAAIATTTSAAAAATSASSSSSSGKRGLAYNVASLATPFVGSSEITWAYNWGSSSDSLTSSLNYVPLLWGTASDFTSVWSSAATAAIAAGSTYLLAFNEPDLSSQSDLSVAEAVSGYQTYMQPFAGKALLGSPAVTSAAAPNGLTYLTSFIAACDGCTIDFVAIHWYGDASDTAGFTSHVAAAYTAGGNRPVWITEFAPVSGTTAEITAFLETVLPWLDSQDYVERYAYFMCSDGVLVSGTELSAIGTTYSTFT